MSRVLALCLAAACLCACAEDPLEPSFEPECTVNSFRACETDECKGAQQCMEPGYWDPCFCTVIDASYPPPNDAGLDSDAGDSPPD